MVETRACRAPLDRADDVSGSTIQQQTRGQPESAVPSFGWSEN